MTVVAVVAVGFLFLQVTTPGGKVIFNSSDVNSGSLAVCAGKTAAQCNQPCAWDKDSK